MGVNVKRRIATAQVRPRSHSLVVRATGNRVGSSLGGSNPSLGAKMQQLLENIQTKANDAIADWMEGNTKSALDLLKEIGFYN